MHAKKFLLIQAEIFTAMRPISDDPEPLHTQGSLEIYLSAALQVWSQILPLHLRWLHWDSLVKSPSSSTQSLVEGREVAAGKLEYFRFVPRENQLQVPEPAVGDFARR